MPSTPNRRGAWIFSAVMLLIGSWLLWQSVRPVAAWWEVRDWAPTSATIQDISMLRVSSENAVKRRLAAQYEYEFAGESFTGSRTFATGSNWFDGREYWLYDVLAKLQSADRPTTCFVDPHRPSDAVLERRFPFGETAMPLALASIVFGFATLFTANARKWCGGRDAKLQTRYPDQPWLWSPHWKRGRLPSEHRYLLGETLGGYLAIGGFTGVMLSIMLFDNQRPGGLIIALNLIFGCLLLFMTVGVVRSLIQRALFGRSTLRLDTVPAVLGGRLQGAVLAPHRVKNAEAVMLALTCTRTRRDSTADDEGEREQESTETSMAVTPERDSGGVRLPFDFHVPSSATPTSWENQRLVTWRVKASARLPGMDYHASFVVPVFEVDRRSDA